MDTVLLRDLTGNTKSFSKIDLDDYDSVNKYKWYLSKDGYAQGYTKDYKTIHSFLHRFIMNAEKGDIVDHINGDKLDNRKCNLRIVSFSQNAQNRSKKDGCTSNYIGVYCDKNTKKWICTIRINGIPKSKSFENETHAAYWYDQLAVKNYGTGAKINGIEKPINFMEPIENIRNLPRGVYLINNKYITRFKNKHIGCFDTIEEAKQAYLNKKQESVKQVNEIKRNAQNIAIIITSKEEEILVDDNKYHNLNKYTWHTNNGYAISKENGKDISMHRLLLGGDLIDHINGNRLDNRLSNLRTSTPSLNSHNRIKKDGGTSKYIGVWFVKSKSKFQAGISKEGKRYTLGYFKTEEEAAKAYNKKALELYGDYANINIIESGINL